MWISGLSIGLVIVTMSVLARVTSIAGFVDILTSLAVLGCPFLISFRILIRAELSEVRVAMMIFNVGFSITLGIVYSRLFMPFADAQAGLIYLLILPAAFLAMLFLRVIAAVVADFRGNVR